MLKLVDNYILFSSVFYSVLMIDYSAYIPLLLLFIGDYNAIVNQHHKYQ